MIEKLFPELDKDQFFEINLNEESKNTDVDLSDAKICEEWIEELVRSKNKKYAWGGFLEDRSNLLKSCYNIKEHKFIHIGVDYIVPEKTRIHLPYKGEVYDVFNDKDKNGGWGGRVIFKLMHSGFYLLFGHLEEVFLRKKRMYRPNEIIGRVGSKEENGNWFPHLHIQMFDRVFLNSHKDIREIDGYLSKNNPLLRQVVNPLG